MRAQSYSSLRTERRRSFPRRQIERSHFNSHQIGPLPVTSSARLCHTRSGVGLQHLAILTILTSHTSTFSRVYLPVRPSSKLDAAADKCDDGLLTKATATSEPTSQRLASTIFSKSMAGRTYFVTLIFCRSVTENSTSFIRLQ